MSWNGTVRCGHCYNTGHNRRGCPKLKAYAAENPDSYQAQKMRDNASRAKKRRCTYCAKIGHNRRGCESFKTRVAGDVAMSRRYRRNFVKYVNDMGLTPGALVIRRSVETYNRETREYTTHDRQVCQLLSITWDAVDFNAGVDRYTFPKMFTFAPVADLANKRERFADGLSSHPSASVPREGPNRLLAPDDYYTTEWELASPSTGSIEPPSGWYADDAKVRGDLKEAKSPDYDDNKWGDE